MDVDCVCVCVRVCMYVCLCVCAQVLFPVVQFLGKHWLKLAVWSTFSFLWTTFCHWQLSNWKNCLTSELCCPAVSLGVFAFFLLAVIENWPKTPSEMQIFLSSCRLMSTMKGSQGRNSESNLEAGTEAEVVEEHCILDCSSWPTQLAFFYHPKWPALRGTAHTALSFPNQALIKKTYHLIAFRPLWWRHFLH